MSFRPEDLVGYQYKADTYCGADIGARLAQDGWPVCPAEVARVDGEPECADTAEVMLDDLAHCAPLPAAKMPIDREDESSFDSGDFPKVELRYQAEDANACCAICGKRLADLTQIPTSVRS